ncbi:MAG TPA: DUF4169 family protein [Aliiroseovarius sp.]|nr:DUF4169 family protein [Aliiroseovarius sp.]
MADPVNLNKFRKAKIRADKRTNATANAAKFGRRKAQKSLDKARSEKTARRLDGHKRDP